jgi:hypothetical protein
MTDTMTSQNIDLSSWDKLFLNSKEFRLKPVSTLFTIRKIVMFYYHFKIMSISFRVLVWY